VFAPLSAVLSLLFLPSTLANGIRLVELPPEGESVEIVAGYTSGGLTGLSSTAAAKSLLMDAYAAGAAIDFIQDMDRTALRITAPNWATPMLIDHLPELFREIPKDNAEATTAPVPGNDFRSKVEEEIRSALLGPMPSRRSYATDDGFVLISAPVPASLRDALASIPKRASGLMPNETIDRLAAERTLRFKPELSEGSVIFASPISGVYYKQWYTVLLLDRLIRHIVPLRLKTAMPLTVNPYYYRLELTVPSGQFPEPAEENLLQELQRLQFVPANARDLAAARQEAIDYLDSRPVREWFASHDLLARRDEGKQWIQSMSADEMRVAARDLLIMNRVIAAWAPKPRQTTVSSELLSSASATVPSASATAVSDRTAEASRSELPARAFPAHSHPAFTAALPERLISGVWLAASTANAVYASGGAMTRFEREPGAEDLKAFQQYRADRILVLAPAPGLERARRLWSTFKGSPDGEGAASRGKVSSGDLSALLVLKTILDLKIIQAGWWHDVSVRMDAGQGSDLHIVAPEQKRAEIIGWIKSIASAGVPDANFTWVREIALHHFSEALPDLQALTWERDSQGLVQDPQTVSSRHVQDVARIYF